MGEKDHQPQNVAGSAQRVPGLDWHWHLAEGPVEVDTNSATDLPLLGVVSLVTNEAHVQAERRSLKRFAGALMALVALFAVGMATLAYQMGSFS